MSLKDRKLRFLKERRLWRLEAKDPVAYITRSGPQAIAQHPVRKRSSNQAIGLVVLKQPKAAVLKGQRPGPRTKWSALPALTAAG